MVGLSLAVAYRFWSKRASDETSTFAPVNDAVATAPAGAAEKAKSLLSEITSTPSGAEVVYQGTVIGTTPAKVERSAYEQLILVRKPGYESKLVRVSAASEPVIHLELVPEHRGKAPSKETKSRGK
jgi:hypothetical protein